MALLGPDLLFGERGLEKALSSFSIAWSASALSPKNSTPMPTPRRQ